MPLGTLKREISATKNVTTDESEEKRFYARNVRKLVFYKTKLEEAEEDFNEILKKPISAEEKVVEVKLAHQTAAELFCTMKAINKKV